VDLKHRLAMSFSELGVWTRSMGQGQKSQQYFENALELRRILVKKEPQLVKLKRYLTYPLGSLGDRSIQMGLDQEARSYLQESLAIHQELNDSADNKKTNIRIIRNDLAAALATIARLAFLTGCNEEAHDYFDKAVRLRRTAAEIAPQRPQGDLATVLKEFGTFYVETERFEESIRLLEESITILRKLFKRQPKRTDWQQLLASSLRELGHAERQSGRQDAARAHLEEAVALLSALEALEPLRIGNRYHLVKTLNRLGELEREEKQCEAARRCFQAAVNRLDALLALDPPRADFRLDLADACWNLHLLAETDTERLAWLDRMREILQPLQDMGMQRPRLDRLWNQLSASLARPAEDSR